MEYTNDVVFKVHYKKDKLNNVTYMNSKKLKKIIKKLEEDSYFTVVMIISAVVLFIDFFIVKSFIEIVNLL